MKKQLHFIFVLIMSIAVSSETFEEFQKKQREGTKTEQQSFKDYEKNSKQEFSAFVREQEAALKAWQAEYSEPSKSGLRSISIAQNSSNSVSMHDVNYTKGTLTVKSVVSAKTKQEVVQEAVNTVRSEISKAANSADPESKGAAALEIPLEEFGKTIKVKQVDKGFVASVEIEKPIAKVLPVPVGEAAKPSRPIRTDYTSLIIDARGLSAKACLIPMVQSASGKVVYGPKEVSKESAVNGMAVWVDKIESAKISVKAGTAPLLVKAEKVNESKRFVIADDSAEVISALSGSSVLRDCKVIFVVD
ncbi:MAG: hypothetical protein JNL74_05705 [Fibrobacteres bacterium]|nr:hypothetical protein [Fibrobacterota bacterium]